MRSVPLIALAVLAALALSGCVESAPAGSQTLGQTKSPVQLIRNEVANRVPTDLVADILNTQDDSTNCRTPETDPEGLLRSWRSIIRFQLVYGENVDVMTVVDDLAESFVDQGWDRGIYGTASIIELTRSGSETNIHISTKKANDETQVGAEIQLAVAGPCVMTAGKDSSEVLGLGTVDDE